MITKTYAATLAQMLKFGLIGSGATMIHAIAYLGWAQLRVPPLIANFLAFCIAVSVSFFGHFHWTFPQIRGARRRVTSFARFTTVALLGLVLNTLAVYLVVDTLMLQYQYAVIPMVTIVPLVVFILSRFWAFR